jgi:hypothetical protein
MTRQCHLIRAGRLALGRAPAVRRRRSVRRGRTDRVTRAATDGSEVGSAFCGDDRIRSPYSPQRRVRYRCIHVTDLTESGGCPHPSHRGCSTGSTPVDGGRRLVVDAYYAERRTENRALGTHSGRTDPVAAAPTTATPGVAHRREVVSDRVYFRGGTTPPSGNRGARTASETCTEVGRSRTVVFPADRRHHRRARAGTERRRRRATNQSSR